jgi:hypothetical protein
MAQNTNSFQVKKEHTTMTQHEFEVGLAQENMRYVITLIETDPMDFRAILDINRKHSAALESLYLKRDTVEEIEANLGPSINPTTGSSITSVTTLAEAKVQTIPQ